MESRHGRRAVLCDALRTAAGGMLSSAAFAQNRVPPLSNAEEWLQEALTTRSLAAPLRLSRFVEPIYYLLEPGILWKPNPDNGTQFESILVSPGFVTDLASIPPVLFPALRADGEYAQAAIVHDYLYWTQRTTRAYADEVFRIAMRDLEVRPREIGSIYSAVRAFGQTPWDRNAEMKRGGERRFLKNFPKLATSRWAEWKRDSANFYEQDL